MPEKTIEHVGGDNLSVGKVPFAYGGALPIFEDLNIEVKPGEFPAVLGPSGCGNMTLLNPLQGNAALVRQSLPGPTLKRQRQCGSII